MTQLKLKNPKKLGEYDQKYGQRWWADSYDQEEPVMFNIMSEEELYDGQEVTAETVELAKSAKGTPYHKLKKVKAEGVQKQVSMSTKDVQPRKEYKDNSDGQRQGMWFNNAAAYVEKLSEMNGKVLKPTEWADTVHKYAQAGYQLGELTAQSGYEKAKATASTFKKDEVVEDLGEGMTEDNFELGDEPIDLSQIPF